MVICWSLNPGSFLCGDPGPLALGAVLAYRSGDHRQSSKHVKALLELSTHVRYPEHYSSGFRTLNGNYSQPQIAATAQLDWGQARPPTFPPPPPLSPLPYIFSSVGVETKKENLEGERCVMRVAHKIFL